MIADKGVLCDNSTTGPDDPCQPVAMTTARQKVRDRAAGKSTSGPKRVLLYSHDSWGLGHLRRSLAIAGALHRCYPSVDVLIVTGSPVATRFDLPEHCDVLKLPAISKNAEGHYIPRSLSSELEDAVGLRSRLITEAYRSFMPHVVIVDHQLTGLLNEALPMLRAAKSDGRVLIYGMRDVLDSPEVVDRAWSQPEQQWALHEAYDRICVYGDPTMFDPRARYSALAGLEHKITFSGFVVAPLDIERRAPVPSLRKRVVVTMGGGEDGEERIACYIEALGRKPVTWDSHIVTGPLMPESEFRHFKRLVYRHGLSEQVRLSRFFSNIPRLLQESDVAVSMAGYNSCVELMQSRIPAILMPRQHPRLEQLIRASKLEEMGLARCLRELDPDLLRTHVEDLLARPKAVPKYPPLDGLTRVCDLVREVMSCKSPGHTQTPGHLRSSAG